MNDRPTAAITAYTRALAALAAAKADYATARAAAFAADKADYATARAAKGGAA